MGEPKKHLLKIGALDVLSRVLLGFFFLIWYLSFPGYRIGNTPRQIFLFALGILFGTLIEIAISLLIVKGYTIGIVLKTIYNLSFGYFCFMAFWSIFLAAASETFRSKAGIYLLLFIASGLHFVFSVYFQYTAMFYKPVRAYLSTLKNERLQKTKKGR